MIVEENFDDVIEMFRMNNESDKNESIWKNPEHLLEFMKKNANSNRTSLILKPPELKKYQTRALPVD